MEKTILNKDNLANIAREISNDLKESKNVIFDGTIVLTDSLDNLIYLSKEEIYSLENLNSGNLTKFLLSVILISLSGIKICNKEKITKYKTKIKEITLFFIYYLLKPKI